MVKIERDYKMTEEIKTEKSSKTKILINFVIASVLAAVITGACYNYWHSKADIYLTFEAQNERKVDYTVYYAEDAKGNFSRERMIRQKIPAGSHRVEFVFPTKNIARLRIDFGKKPGTVFISDIRLEGNKTLNLNKYDKYKYNKAVDEHEVTEFGGLRVISKKKDPYMVITEKFNIAKKDVYDQNKIGIIFGASFVIIFALAMLLNRKRK